MNRLHQWALGDMLEFYKKDRTVYESFEPFKRPTLNGTLWYICDDALIRIHGFLSRTVNVFPHNPDEIKRILYNTTRNEFAIIQTDNEYRRHALRDTAISEKELERLANHLNIGFQSYNCHPAHPDERHKIPDFLLREAWGTSDFYPLSFSEVINRQITAEETENTLPLP